MAVDLGEWIVGVRSNDDEVVEVVRRALAPLRLDGVDVYPNLSVYRGFERDGARELHRLHRRGVTVLRTASLGRLLRSTVRMLDGFLAPPPGLVPLRAELLVADDVAVLVHDGLAVDLSERRLARSRWRRTEGVAPLWDPQRGEVVVPGPRVAAGVAAFGEIDARWPADPADPAVPPGRYPVRAVLLPGAALAEAGDSPARRLVALAVLLDRSSRAVRAGDLEALARLGSSAEVVGIDGADPGSVFRHLRRLRPLTG